MPTEKFTIVLTTEQMTAVVKALRLTADTCEAHENNRQAIVYRETRKSIISQRDTQACS